MTAPHERQVHGAVSLSGLRLEPISTSTPTNVGPGHFL